MVRSKGQFSLLPAGLVILLFCAVHPLWAQYGDPTENRAVIGRDFPVIIQTEFHYSPDIEVEVPELPQGVRISSGPYRRYYRKEIITEGRREYQTLLELRFNLRASYPDIYEIPGLILQHEGQTTQLEPFYFMSFRWEEFSNLYPLNVEWRDYPEKIYQGQTLPVLLEAKYTESIIFPDEIQLRQPEGALLQRVSLPGEIESKDLDDSHRIYQYPLESWILTSLETGRLTLPGGEVSIRGMTRQIPELSLEVMALPDSVQSSGAVGQFRRSIDWPLPEDIQGGDTIEIRLNLEGRGNFPQIHIADPILEGWELVNRDEENDYLPDAQWGYMGYRTVLYRLKNLEVGNTSIGFEPFFYLDPSNDRIRRLSEEQTMPMVQEPTEETGNTILPLIPVEELLNQRDWFRLYNPWIYLLPLPFLFVMLVLMLMKKKKWGPWAVVLSVFILISSTIATEFPLEQSLLDAQNAYQQENYSEALKLYRSLEEYLSENSFFLYNLSLIQWQQGNAGKAELALRTALKRNPGNSLFINTLERMDKDFQLQNQYDGLLLLKQSWFLIIFLGLTTLMIIFITMHFILNRTRTLLYLTALFSLWVLSGLTLGYVIWENQSEQIIIMEDQTALRKISGDSAKEWIFLQAGTSLEVLERFEDYLFVRTGYGLEGWVRSDQISFLEVDNG